MSPRHPPGRGGDSYSRIRDTDGDGAAAEEARAAAARAEAAAAASSAEVAALTGQLAAAEQQLAATHQHVAALVKEKEANVQVRGISLRNAVTHMQSTGASGARYCGLLGRECTRGA
eukprot:736668-Prorocentrum_minimum.AAC.3